MKGRDEIKELFSDKLGNFEAQVRPDMWANIASQIGGTTTSVASSGLSLLSKTFIGIGIGAAVVTTVLLVIPSENTPIEKGNPINRTSSTNIEEKVAPIDLQISDETVKESIVLQKQTNIPADVRTEPLVNKEIDQDQNFRSNVSLINTQKETGVKYTKEDKNIIEELLSGLISTTLIDLEVEDFDLSITDLTVLKKIKEICDQFSLGGLHYLRNLYENDHTIFNDPFSLKIIYEDTLKKNN